SIPPLEQAAAAIDRVQGPANAFPSNPALPPPANGRRGRRAPLPRHVIRLTQPLVLPSDAFGLRVPAAAPPRARQVTAGCYVCLTYRLLFSLALEIYNPPSKPSLCSCGSVPHVCGSKGRPTMPLLHQQDWKIIF
ncbi:hypothetical protein U0070_006931, partial [Myodes glareolus]